MKKIILFSLIAAALFLPGHAILRYFRENQILRDVIERLQADSRIAEALVSDVRYDEKSGRMLTTIKFLEYDTHNKPLDPRYFTFAGNIIQFQSLVIRFDDRYVRRRDKLRGRSIYLFRKVFMLEGARTMEYDITEINAVPEGYRLKGGIADSLEEKLWRKFWAYALDPAKAGAMGVKNAQIEAPGTMFIPGMLYRIKIEHDGGMRIDAVPLPEILKGEKIQ